MDGLPECAHCKICEQIEPNTIGEAIKWENINFLSCKYCTRKEEHLEDSPSST